MRTTRLAATLSEPRVSIRHWHGIALLIGLTLGSASGAFGQLVLPDTIADAVYGQGGLTNNSANRGQNNPSENTIHTPGGLATDSEGGLYATDTLNNRVLYFPRGSLIPTRVYGQSDSFLTGTENKGGISASSLFRPTGVALDTTGGLYIADTRNNRVLHYPAGRTTADRVYGQNASFTTNTANLDTSTPSRTSLAGPVAVAVDAADGLYIADALNNRVLFYRNGSAIAERVYGQGGDFFSRTPGKGGISANSLSTPRDVTFDGANGLYISDTNHRRILHFSGESTVADRVYGQGNSFESNTANLGGTSNESLANTEHVALDNAGGIYVADFGNNRVLHYPAARLGIADRVYGQANAFNTATSNKGGSPASAESLAGPVGVAVDSAGTLYVSDAANHRILRFDPPPPPTPTVSSISTTPSSPVAGQPFTFTLSGANFNPATVLVEISGPGCPPCVISNAELRTKTATSLSGISNLDRAGNYTFTVRNGAGSPIPAGVPLAVSAAGTPSGSCGCDFNADTRVDISDIISLVRLIQSNTTPACRAGVPFTIADVIQVVTVVQGTASCRL